MSQPTLPRPTRDDDRDGWKAYWGSHGDTYRLFDEEDEEKNGERIVWRIEPEISAARQDMLRSRHDVEPDIVHGIYPFRNIDFKLTRADIEWLLATHPNLSGGPEGPVDWTDKNQRERIGLDLRGADLRGVDLQHLPLARLVGGLGNADLTPELQEQVSGPQFEAAAVVLDGAILRKAHLEESILEYAFLRRAVLVGASLTKSDLLGAHLEGADLTLAHVEGANLRGVIFDLVTDLDRIILGNAAQGTAMLADVRWDGCNLDPQTLETLKVLGDEQVVSKPRTTERYWGVPTNKIRQAKLGMAVRANRQLALALRTHGLNEYADHFAYRAQRLQGRLLRSQGIRKLPGYFGSLLLWTLAGYGYKLGRILIVYVLTLTIFAAIFLALGLPHDQASSPWQVAANALLVSLTAIHGRVFFEFFGIGSPLAWVAAIESVAGIVIEGVFVAMLVQRFFAR